MVIYDEVEYFKGYDDKDFNYPFEKRKNKISSYTFSTSTSSDGEYEYPIERVSLQSSLACLEPSVFEQFAFVGELLETIYSYVDYS